MGRCKFLDCRFRRDGGHPGPNDIPDDFADKVVSMLTKGIQARVLSGGEGGSPAKKPKQEPINLTWHQLTPTAIETKNGKQERLRGSLRKKIRDAERTRTKLEYKCKVAVLGPTACVWAAKLSQRNHCPVDAAEMKAQGKGVEPQRVTITDDDFQVKGEPLYGGKDKRSGLIYNYCDILPLDTHDHAGGQPSPSTITDTARSDDLETTAYAGLNQPRLQSSNSVVLGEAKNQMRRENKQRRQCWGLYNCLDGYSRYLRTFEYAQK